MVTVNVAVVAPEGTVTVDGTLAYWALELKDTTVPEEAAGPSSVIVPVHEFPPTTVLGDKEMLLTLGGLIES